MSDQQEPRISDQTRQDIYELHTQTLAEARDASHRLANRLHEATLSLQVAKAALRQRRFRRFLTSALLVVVSVYASISLLDAHIEGCTVLGRPQTGNTVRILFWEIDTVRFCNVTFPLHDHARERRLVDESFMREQVEQIIKEYEEGN